MAEETIELIPGIDTKIVLGELYYTVKGAMKKLILSSQTTYNSLISQKKYGIRLFSRFSRCCVLFKSV